MKHLDFLHNNVWALGLVGILFSFLFPAIGILISPLLHILFMILMFLSTLDIKVHEVVKDIKRPKQTVITLAIIHLLSPLIVYAFKSFMDPDIYLGLILAASVSSGVSVVFLTKIFGGEPTRSLVITTISNIISPVVVPLLIFLFAQKMVSVSPIDMSMTIVKLIIIPLIAAQIVARNKVWKKKISTYSTETMLALLLIIIIGIISPVRNYIMSNLLISLVLAGIVSILTVINFLAGYYLGKKAETKISYGISASFKNFTLSTVLALSLFSTTVALPAILYAVINSFLLIPMQWFIEGKSHNRSN